MTDRNDAGESWNGSESSTTQEPLVAVASRLSEDSMTVESSEAATELIEETAATRPETFEAVVADCVAGLDSPVTADRLAATRTLHELSSIVPGALSAAIWPLLDRLDESSTRPYNSGRKFFHHFAREANMVGNSYDRQYMQVGLYLEYSTIRRRQDWHRKQLKSDCAAIGTPVGVPLDTVSG